MMVQKIFYNVNRRYIKNINKIPKHFRVIKIPQEYKDIILQIRLENKTYSEKKIKSGRLNKYFLFLDLKIILFILRKCLLIKSLKVVS